MVVKGEKLVMLKRKPHILNAFRLVWGFFYLSLESLMKG